MFDFIASLFEKEKGYKSKNKVTFVIRMSDFSVRKISLFNDMCVMGEVYQMDPSYYAEKWAVKGFTVDNVHYSPNDIKTIEWSEETVNV